MLFIYDCHSWHFQLIADTFLHHLSCPALLCFIQNPNSWGKRPSAYSVFGNYSVEQGLWVSKGTFSLPKLSFHPCLPAMVLLGEKRLSTHLWNQDVLAELDSALI